MFLPALPPPLDHLRTDRLLLRRWTDADLAPFAELNADSVVMEHFEAPLDRAGSDALVGRIEARFAEQGFGCWAVERLDTGELTGFVGLSVPRFEAHFTPCVEVAWRLGRGHWGHGFATEAARAAVDDGFERVGLDEIVAMAVVANARSIAVMDRLGMTHDPADDFDHPDIDEPRLRRHVLYRLARPHAGGFPGS